MDEDGMIGTANKARPIAVSVWCEGYNQERWRRIDKKVRCLVSRSLIGERWSNECRRNEADAMCQ